MPNVLDFNVVNFGKLTIAAWNKLLDKNNFLNISPVLSISSSLSLSVFWHHYMFCGSANAFNRCMSRICKVTRLAWIMHSKASENICTKYISLLSRSASIASRWTRKSTRFCCRISRMTRWNGNRGINKCVVCCKFMISFMAGLSFFGRTCFRVCFYAKMKN